MKLTPFLILWLCISQLLAQPGGTGTPQQALLQQTLSTLDTAKTAESRALALYHVADAYYQNNLPDSVLKYNLMSEAVCRANHLELQLGRTLMAHSRVLINTGEYKAMIPLLTEASQIFEKLGDQRRRAYATGNLANAYVSLGETDNAFAMYKLVSQMMTALADTVGLADCILNMGLIYEDEKGKEDIALEYLEEAVKMYGTVADQEQGIAIGYTTKGNIVRRLGRPKEAIGYFLLAIQAARVVNDKYVIVDIYNALADTYIENKEYDNARKRIEDALKLCDEIGYTRGAMDLKASRATLHTAQQEYPEALALYEANLASAQEAGIKSVVLTSYLGLAETYRKQHHPAKARHYTHLANELQREMKLHVTDGEPAAE